MNNKNQLLDKNYITLKVNILNNNFTIFTFNINNLIDYNKLKDKIINYENKIKTLIIQNQAEIENIRKRSVEDIIKIKNLALVNFITELLPVIDNLERAIESAKIIKEQFLLSLIKGVQLTFKTLNNILKKFGISVIDEINVMFNPNIHQAVALIETDKIPNNHVLMIMQKGYILNGKLIRPATVTVAKN